MLRIVRCYFFDGIDLLDSVEAKIAVITLGLINNHSFVMAIRELVLRSCIVSTIRITFILKYRQTELIELGIGIADGR